MVSEEAFSGKKELNPYHFQHFNVTDFVFKIGGENSPFTPYKPNFENGNYMREYTALMNCIGI